MQTMPQTGWRDGSRELTMALVGTVIVVAVRLWFGRQMQFCGTPDSCSYLALAESLGRHHGFVENFLYDFQIDRLQLPTHGIEYWLPGTSFFLLLAMPFGGVTLHSSIVIATLAGVLLSLAAWKIVRNYGGSRGVACASYLLCLVLPPMWFGSLTPDSVLFYGAAVAWFLVLFRVRFRSYTEDAVALLCFAVATLIRNDAILLLVPALVVLWLRSRASPGKGSSRGYCVLLGLSCLAMLIPKHAIDYAVLGTAFPSGSMKVFFMYELTDMSSYGKPVTLASYLALGAGRLIRVRAAALPLMLYRIAFLLLGFACIFLPALALRREKRETAVPEVAGGAAFAVTLLLVYSLLLPAIQISILRSFCALLPLCAVLIVVAIRQMVPDRRTAAGLTVATVLFYFVSGTMEDRRTVPEQNQIAEREQVLAASLLAHGAAPGEGTLVMTADPAQFSETTAYAAVPLPENGLPAARQAADALQATHVLIDTDKLQGTMEEVRSTLEPTGEWPVPGTHVVVLRLRASRTAP